MRIASSTRPGSAIPPTQAAPPANASASAVGRSLTWKSRCQPHALKACGREEEKGRAGHEHRVGVVDRPAAADEVANAEERDGEQDEPEATVQRELNFPIGEKPHHRSRNGAIGSGDA